MKRRDLDTETDRYSGKPSCEREGRDEGDVSSSQRIPEMASKPQDLGQRHGKDSLSHTSEGTHPANCLLLKLLHRLVSC